MGERAGEAGSLPAEADIPERGRATVEAGSRELRPPVLDDDVREGAIGSNVVDDVDFGLIRNEPRAWCHSRTTPGRRGQCCRGGSQSGS